MKKSPGTLKVALLQMSAGSDKAANLAKALTLAQKAAGLGSGLVLLPEVFHFRGDAKNRPMFLEAREDIPGPSTQPFMDLARKTQVSFLLGSILEKAGGRHAYNTSVLVDARGRIAAKYRKIHLFEASIGDKIIREADYFKAGSRPAMAIQGPFKLGLSVCYDLRFPDLYQGYSRRGANILTAPSCFTRKTGKAHWETLLRARAIENLAYVLAPAQVGFDGRGIEAYGHSMIVSPWGEIVAGGSASSEEIVLGTLDIEEVKKARQILPGIASSGNPMI